MDEIDCVVIGAGVVGLAVARALAMAGRAVVIVERETAIGAGISARNSEVIHAGIYAPPDWLKTRLCVAGRKMLYAYCAERGIGHRRCGKLIVATDPSQAAGAERLIANGRANGVADLRWLDAAAVKALEPELATCGAVYSPSTGIIDSHAFMLSLLGDAEAHGATIAYGAAIAALTPMGDGIALTLSTQPEPAAKARLVVNCAGLGAIPLAQTIAGFPQAYMPRPCFAKGSYFALSGAAPARHLVYPMPEPGGLGIHLTLDLAGQARFGPDVEWIDAPHYDVDPAKAGKFLAAIQAYWPDVALDRLSPGYAGVRPKIAGPGQPNADFRIDGPEVHGLPGLINLFGIESPGLTASLAIGDLVARLAQTSSIN